MRNRLKVAQVDAMLRLKLLCPPYHQFEYHDQPPMDMFDKGLDSGLLAQLNKEVSGAQATLWRTMKKMMCRIAAMLTGLQLFQSVLMVMMWRL